MTVGRNLAPEAPAQRQGLLPPFVAQVRTAWARAAALPCASPSRKAVLRTLASIAESLTDEAAFIHLLASWEVGCGGGLPGRPVPAAYLCNERALREFAEQGTDGVMPPLWDTVTRAYVANAA